MLCARHILAASVSAIPGHGIHKTQEPTDSHTWQVNQVAAAPAHDEDLEADTRSFTVLHATGAALTGVWAGIPPEPPVLPLSTIPFLESFADIHLALNLREDRFPEAALLWDPPADFNLWNASTTQGCSWSDFLYAVNRSTPNKEVPAWLWNSQKQRWQEIQVTVLLGIGLSLVKSSIKTAALTWGEHKGRFLQAMCLGFNSYVSRREGDTYAGPWLRMLVKHGSPEVLFEHNLGNSQKYDRPTRRQQQLGFLPAKWRRIATPRETG